MYSVEVVADDFTGAMDTSHGFATRGYATRVIVDPESDIEPLERSAVVGVNTDTRYVDVQDARETVIDAVEGVDTRTVYKKVDSTLRGNVAAETDAILEAIETDFALVVPAFPATGRTTEGGVHYVNGTPVADTEYGDDENGPVVSSIPELFSKIERIVETVPLSTIETGTTGVAAALEDVVDRAVRPPIVICDATEASHVATAAAASTRFDPLYVGSAELARHVVVDADKESSDPSVPPRTGSPMGVVGSVSETTLTQLEYVPDEVIVAMDGPTLVTRGYPTEAVTRARSRLHDERSTVLTAATSDEDVERTLCVGRKQGILPSTVQDRVMDELATAAADVVREISPSGLLLTGGDIAVTVSRKLNATAVSLSGEEIEPGVPIGTFSDGDVAGMRLISKAGGFGSEETINNCLDVLTV